MGGSKAIMHDQGLDFLLRQTNTTGDGAEMVSKLQDKSENITIRGELNKISLTDIFQTLSMSKMEGILRVHRPLENRLVHFQESGVRLLMIDRDETRRIGHRLVQSGLISAADLRSALLEQQQSKMPLGEALVGSGKITEERLATTLQNQLEEDLYSLFTWDSGSFEFYKHVGEEDGFAQMIEGTPGFLIDGILLEVARRADEWREILRVIGSVHEVPYFVQDQEPTEMADDVRTLFTAVDEISTVQELADATMLGLFTCAKAICSLIQQDILALSPATALVELARTAAHHGDHKRTLQLSQTAQSHQDEINFELSHSLAGILQTCREPKLGAQILMSCADSLSDPKSKLAIGKSAYELDRYSHEVLLFLRTQLELDGQHAAPLFAEVTDQLCSTLADRGDYELALRFHADLEELHPHEASLLTRKARILQAADRTEDALSILAEARTLIEPTGDKTRLIKLYEQILKLNPQAKDVKKALRELRNGKLRARQRQLGTILIGLAALGILWLGWSWYDHNRRFETAVTNFRDSLSKQDINGARQHLAAAQLELGEGNKWNMLRDELTATTARVDARRKSAEIKAVQQSLSQAGDLIQSGQVAEALTIYQGQLARRTQHRGVRKLIKKCSDEHFNKILEALSNLSTTLHENLPGPAPVLGPLKSFQQSASLLRAKASMDVTLAHNVLSHSKSKTLVELADPGVLQRVISTAEQIVATSRLATDRLPDYVARIERLEKHRRLDPVFNAARTAEQDLDFQSAENLYRQLYQEYRTSPTHASLFRDRVAQYTAINKSLRLLGKSTKANDFVDARAHYRHLLARYPEFPWAKTIQLPVHIVTTPSGAKVKFNGVAVGTTPLVVPFTPGTQYRVEVHHPGFLPEQMTLHGDTVGMLRAVLTLAPHWSIKTKGAVDKPPVADTNRIFMVDRAGVVVAWSRTKKQQLWTQDVGDLSGLLTQPVLFDNQVLIGSIDGLLRAFDPASGELLWEIPALPMESAPHRLGSDLVIVTTDHRLVVVDVLEKAIRWTSRLNAKSDVKLSLVDGCALVILDNQTMRAISIRERIDRWPPIALDPGLVARPFIHKSTAVLCTDEGHISAYDTRSGKHLWHRTGLGELRWQPTAGGSRLFVAATANHEASARVLSFDLHSGNPGPTYQAEATTVWSCPPSAIDGALLLGTRAGPILVLDQRQLQVHAKIRGSGTACAKPVSLPNGDLICSFDGKEVLILWPFR